jgi:intracellular sulfur oxidation DsrE/DsrF family protein
MRWHKGLYTSMLMGLALAAAMAAGPVRAQDVTFWTTPTIHGYGKMHYLPHAAYKPDPAATYKVVFGMSIAASKPGEVDPALDHVARAVNLYVAAGVPLSHLKFVAVAYGPATTLALDNAHYEAMFHVPNPNLDLIAKLRKAGVDVAVCGQAVAEHHFQYAWIARGVTIALSALTTLTTLQHEGYALVPM